MPPAGDQSDTPDVGAPNLKTEDRKAAVAAYKDRKIAAGVYVVRCMATGQRWAGTTLDLARIWNRLSFTLRQGADPRRAFQAAWLEHGSDSFTFEVIERVDVEELVHGRDRVLKARLDHWCEALPAEPI